MKDKITIEIDMAPIIEHANKYIKKKVIADLKEHVEGIIIDSDYPNITVEEKIDEYEKLLDWYNDLKLGWIDMSQYCKNCKKSTKKNK